MIVNDLDGLGHNDGCDITKLLSIWSPGADVNFMASNNNSNDSP